MAETIVQVVKKIVKRVVCLYRVSTVGQVEKDDIPMLNTLISLFQTQKITRQFPLILRCSPDKKLI